MKPYEGCKVYGPYHRPDGRQHVVCLYLDSFGLEVERKTISYPKYLIEQHLGRYLLPGEVVHHRDEDKTNNRLENLVVESVTNHKTLHIRKTENRIFVCPVCKTEFILTGKQVEDRERAQNIGRCKTGPYCSRKCRGVGTKPGW